MGWLSYRLSGNGQMTGVGKRSLVGASLFVALALVAAGAAAMGGVERAQVLRVSIPAEPPSLDPGLATDVWSANVLGNIMYPLVYLGRDEDLSPQPGAATSWTMRGSTVTLKLRKSVRWTTGQPVTAQDYVWSWLRTISPELGADYAYQFFGIEGAAAYNSCDPSKTNCNALRSKVAISAQGRYTLVIHLTSPQAWFVQQLSLASFLPVNRATVEKYGDKWTEAANIVTNGPFRLASWKHDYSLTLVPNPTFDPGGNSFVKKSDVKLSKVVLTIIPDGTTALHAFKAGNTDVDASGIPPASVAAEKKTPYWHLYPLLSTYYYGFNVKNVADVNQRRAMAFAIDRKAIIRYILHGSHQPARGFTPIGISGGPTILKTSFLPVTAQLAKAKTFMAKVQSPKKDIDLFVNQSSVNIDIAVAVQFFWKQLGLDVTIRSIELKQYLEFLGPPPNDDVDVFRLAWVADYPDAYNFLSLWTCTSGNNNTNWCNRKFDSLMAKAARTTDTERRKLLYQRAESMLSGPSGDVPIMPILWVTYPDLEQAYVHGFRVNPLGQALFSTVWLS